MKQEKVYIYGRHALKEALLYSPQVIDRVFLSEKQDDKKLRNTIKNAGILLSPLGSDKKGISDSAVHQGVIARISLNKLVMPYENFIKNFKINSDTSVLILGEIQDPHNVGAIIRSAVAFGVSAVLIPQHNQAHITGAVVKVSAGMVFKIPLVEIGNINNVIRNLKNKGFWIYGLDEKADQNITDESFDQPTVFILGNEAKGIRQKTLELCDTLISIPINPKCESLNVAASTAVAIFAWSQQHPQSLK